MSVFRTAGGGFLRVGRDEIREDSASALANVAALAATLPANVSITKPAEKPRWAQPLRFNKGDTTTDKK